MLSKMQKIDTKVNKKLLKILHVENSVESKNKSKK